MQLSRCALAAAVFGSFFAVAATSRAVENWPQFRGPRSTQRLYSNHPYAESLTPPPLVGEPAAQCREWTLVHSMQRWIGGR